MGILECVLGVVGGHVCWGPVELALFATAVEDSDRLDGHQVTAQHEVRTGPQGELWEVLQGGSRS